MVVVVKVSPVDRDLCSRAAHLDLPVLCPPLLAAVLPTNKSPWLAGCYLSDVNLRIGFRSIIPDENLTLTFQPCPTMNCEGTKFI